MIILTKFCEQMRWVTINKNTRWVTINKNTRWVTMNIKATDNKNVMILLYFGQEQCRQELMDV